MWTVGTNSKHRRDEILQVDCAERDTLASGASTASRTARLWMCGRLRICMQNTHLSKHKEEELEQESRSLLSLVPLTALQR